MTSSPYMCFGVRECISKVCLSVYALHFLQRTIRFSELLLHLASLLFAAFQSLHAAFHILSTKVMSFSLASTSFFFLIIVILACFLSSGVDGRPYGHRFRGGFSGFRSYGGYRRFKGYPHRYGNYHGYPRFYGRYRHYYHQFVGSTLDQHSLKINTLLEIMSSSLRAKCILKCPCKCFLHMI